MSLASNVSTLATRIATEIKAVRTEMTAYAKLRTARSVTASTTAVAGEVLRANATSGAISVAPPASPTTGTQVTVIKTDATANVVTFTGTINGDAGGAQLLSAYAGATFHYDGSAWVVLSVNTAFSGGITSAALAAKQDAPAANALSEIDFSLNKLQMVKNEYVTFSASTEVTLLDVTGPGVVTSIWMAAYSNVAFDGRLRVYYDGSPTATIDIDFGTLFATHWLSNGVQFTPHMATNMSGATSATASAGYLFTFPLPFGTSIKVTAYNPTAGSSNFFSMASYRATATDTANGKRLRCAGVRYSGGLLTRTAAGTNVLANITGGPGALVWHSYVGGVNATNFSWMERNFSISVDGEGSPSVVASGTEDWFDSAWYFNGWANTNVSAHSYIAVDNTTTFIAGMATDFLSKWGGVTFNSSCVLTALTEAHCNTGDSFVYAILYYQ